MAIKLFVISILILNIVCCNNNSSKSNSISNNERIKFLNNASSKDSIVQYFLQYINQNNLATTLVNYEDHLINEKILESTSITSFEKFITTTIANNNNGLCILKADLKKFQNTNTKFNYPIIDNKYEEISNKSKEYILYNYLMSNGGLNIYEALKYAVENNVITFEKKYFYLFLLMPNKSCD